jgi:hypothetical protein
VVGQLYHCHAHGHSVLEGVGCGHRLHAQSCKDWAGRLVINSAVIVATRGTFAVSAAFSGKPLFGVLAGPVMTGSGVMAASGVTGLGSTWNTAAPVAVSAVRRQRRFLLWRRCLSSRTLAQAVRSTRHLALAA